MVAMLMICMAISVRLYLERIFDSSARLGLEFSVLGLVAVVFGGGPCFIAMVLCVLAAIVWPTRIAENTASVELVFLCLYGTVIALVTDFTRRHYQRDRRRLEEQVALFKSRLQQASSSIQERSEARREMERSLHFNEAKLDAVFQTLNEGVVIFSPSGQLMETNHAVRPDNHDTMASLMQPPFHTFQNLIHPDFTPLLPGEHPVFRALRTRQPVRNVEIGFAYPEGSIAWRLVNARPVFAEGGNLLGAVASFFDITERKKAEDALRQAHDLSEAIINTVPVIVLLLDTMGRIIRFNPFMERLAGWSLKEIRERDWFETFLTGTDRVASRDLFHKALFGETSRGLTNAIKTKDGKILDIDWYTVPLKATNGKLIGLLCAGRDVTDLKRAEALERANQARLRAILDTASDAIITIGFDDRIQSVNVSAEKLFGCSAQECIGKDIRELIPWLIQDKSEQYLARYLQIYPTRVTGTSRESSARRKDGSIFPIDLSLTQIPQPPLFTAIIRDATNRKELERQVVEVASEEQRRIGQDLHDTIGQELTALNLQLVDLADTFNTDPSAAAQTVDRMNRTLQRCKRELRIVLRGLLPVQIDAEGLMAALFDLAERTRQENNINCTFECPETVALSDNLVATHLYLIAQEAVHNAVKHARPQIIRITLEKEAADGLMLRVSDDGIGMATGALNSGLGLRIMRNRASIIGANLSIESAAPTGMVVTCKLMGIAHEK